MGRIERPSDGRAWYLRSRHLIGRSSACDLQWGDGRISGEHATVFWTGLGWALRDLGSRNGCWAKGARVPRGEEASLAQGDVLCLGASDNELVLVDAAPPEPFVVGGEAERGGAMGLLAIGDAASVYRTPAGHWVLEDGGQLVPVADRHVLQRGGTRLVLHLPSEPAGTEDAMAPTLDQVVLELRVSQDEEHVAALARCGARCVELRRRTHHYLLLTLARARLADADAPISERGWVDFDRLVKMLRSNANRVNVEIFRAREQLADAGILDAAGLIERRPGQVRIGLERVVVQREVV